MAKISDMFTAHPHIINRWSVMERKNTLTLVQVDLCCLKTKNCGLNNHTTIVLSFADRAQAVIF